MSVTQRVIRLLEDRIRNAESRDEQDFWLDELSGYRERRNTSLDGEYERMTYDGRTTGAAHEG